jgi:CBS domain-containing protein
VLNEVGELVGILTIKDVLRATIPVYLDTKLAKFSWDGMLEEMARRVACRKVKEFMSTKVLTVSEEAPLMTCADLLIQEKMQRLPVIGKDNKVVGIVYIRDIFNVISQIFLDQEECKL